MSRQTDLQLKLTDGSIAFFEDFMQKIFKKFKSIDPACVRTIFCLGASMTRILMILTAITHKQDLKEARSFGFTWTNPKDQKIDVL